MATFIANGAAQFGVAGNDVLMEFDYSEIYAPVDLKIGRCRLSVAAPEAMAETKWNEPFGVVVSMTRTRSPTDMPRSPALET